MLQWWHVGICADQSQKYYEMFLNVTTNLHPVLYKAHVTINKLIFHYLKTMQVLVSINTTIEYLYCNVLGMWRGTQH